MKNSILNSTPEISLTFNKNKYRFSNFQLIVFFLGTPILSFLIYLFLKLKINYWIYEFTSHQVVFILNNLFKLDSYVINYSDTNMFPSIYIPNHPFNEFYAITTNCIAAHIFSILIGVIVCIPSSKYCHSKKDFVWRKIKAFFFSVGIIYLLNIFRISLLLYLNYKGIPFLFIHESLFFLSAIIGALIFIFVLKKWLPEAFISIYYFYRLLIEKRKENKKI